jgi:hypothetical protein
MSGRGWGVGGKCCRRPSQAHRHPPRPGCLAQMLRPGWHGEPRRLSSLMLPHSRSRLPGAPPLSPPPLQRLTGPGCHAQVRHRDRRGEPRRSGAVCHLDGGRRRRRGKRQEAPPAAPGTPSRTRRPPSRRQSPTLRVGCCARTGAGSRVGTLPSPRIAAPARRIRWG